MKRLVEPAISLEALPRIDLVLLSHAHMDHFDLPTLRALESRRPMVVTARATSDLLRVPRYGSVQEVGWQQQVQAGPATIRGLQVRHWGARMRSDTWRGYNGYLIRVGRHRVLFGGDTAMTDHFRAVGGAHLALMPIGAYRPWIANHCNPEQAWQMANDARADMVLPIHHRTFTLSQEPPAEPLERLLLAAGASHASRIPVRAIGDELRLT
jgi:L-ascorbate metabolism protein UlaG (beta-lactamase superfamily)